MKKVRIAIIPTRRGISSNRKGAFTKEDALAAKQTAWEHLSKICDPSVEFLNIDFLNDEGIMYDDAHADIVADQLEKEKLDGVFILMCNFGCEEAVGRVCRRLKKPVFLWGARDKAIAEDGSRSTDTQCGLFASSRILKRYGVQFTYAFNCSITDAEFADRFSVFLGVTRVISTFNHLRIGQINARPKYFTSVMINESALIEQLGIEVVPVNIAAVSNEMQQIRSEESLKLRNQIADLRSRMDCTKRQKSRWKLPFAFAWRWSVWQNAMT